MELEVLALLAAMATGGSLDFQIRTQTQAEQAAVAYSFCVTQAETVRQAAERYPLLRARGALADQRFESLTGQGCLGVEQALARYFEAAYGSDKLIADLEKDLLSRISADSLSSFETATAFIDEVERRAKGDMDLGVLHSLLDAAPLYRRSPAEALSNGFYDFYTPAKHPKGHRVPVQIRVPLGWRPDEGNGKHIVRKWVRTYGTRNVAMFYLQVFPLTSTEEYQAVESELRASSLEEIVGPFVGDIPDLHVSKGKRISMGLRPAVSYQVDVAARQMDVVMHTRSLCFLSAHERGVVILCGGVVEPEPAETLDEAFAVHDALYRRIANSMVFQSD